MFGRIYIRHMSSIRSTVNNPETRKLIDKILRVDHAGEYGAVRIYAGQMAVLSRTNVMDSLRVLTIKIVQ